MNSAAARNAWGHVLNQAEYGEVMTFLVRKDRTSAAVIPADIGALIDQVGGLDKAREILKSVTTH